MQCNIEQTTNGGFHNGSPGGSEAVVNVDVSKPTPVILSEIMNGKLNVLSNAADGYEATDTQSAGMDSLANGNEVNEETTSLKRSKRVTFPENEKVVQSYLSPPDPWKDGKMCTTEILLQAYYKACERLNVKPLSKLVQQLHVVTNFSVRNDTLSLRGEKLDIKQVEALEEIFRRVQFRTMDLENTYLDEEGAIALFDMIEYYESAVRLNISGNRSIGFRGWQSCSRMLKRTPSLVHLEARGCLLAESNMGFLSRPIRMGCFLRVLHLENTNMSGKSLIILGTALKMNDILKELYLGENKLVASDSIQLSNILKHNSSLAVLDVRNNSLQDVGVAHICDGLCEQTSGDRGLRTLVLFNNQLTYQAMSSLSRVLLITNNMTCLNVGHNSITNEGIHRLKESLLANKTLTSLGLQSARISCEGAIALAEYIAESHCLLNLDLRENEIKTAGLMALSLSLKVNQSVTRVDLDRELKKEGMKDYVEQQRRLLQDVTNYTMRNAELLRLHEESELERQHLLEQEVTYGGEVADRDTPATDYTGVTGPELAADRRQLLEEEVESVSTSKSLDNSKDFAATPHMVSLAQLSARDRLHLAIPARSILRDLASPPGLPVANLVGMVFEVPSDSPQIIPPAEASESSSPSNPFFVPTNFPLSPMVSQSGHPVLTPYPRNLGDNTSSANSPMDSSWVEEGAQDEGYVNPLFLHSEDNRDLAIACGYEPFTKTALTEGSHEVVSEICLDKVMSNVESENDGCKPVTSNKNITAESEKEDATIVKAALTSEKCHNAAAITTSGDPYETTINERLINLRGTSLHDNQNVEEMREILTPVEVKLPEFIVTREDESKDISGLKTDCKITVEAESEEVSIDNCSRLVSQLIGNKGDSGNNEENLLADKVGTLGIREGVRESSKDVSVDSLASDHSADFVVLSQDTQHSETRNAGNEANDLAIITGTESDGSTTNKTVVADDAASSSFIPLNLMNNVAELELDCSSINADEALTHDLKTLVSLVPEDGPALNEQPSTVADEQLSTLAREQLSAVAEQQQRTPASNDEHMDGSPLAGITSRLLADKTDNTESNAHAPVIVDLNTVMEESTSSEKICTELVVEALVEIGAQNQLGAVDSIVEVANSGKHLCIVNDAEPDVRDLSPACKSFNGDTEDVSAIAASNQLEPPYNHADDVNIPADFSVNSVQHSLQSSSEANVQLHDSPASRPNKTRPMPLPDDTEGGSNEAQWEDEIA